MFQYYRSFHYYSRRPLFRTRKGPEILFEIANVRNNQNFKNLTEIR